MNKQVFPLNSTGGIPMRSLIRYGLVAVGTLALLTISFVTFRARLEQKAQAQNQPPRANQVAGCDTSKKPALPTAGSPNGNPCLVISSFRQNGPNGTQDEFVEIFNASNVNVTAAELSSDPGVLGTANGIGVFVSAGNGRHPTFGQAANVASLACQIPGSAVIRGRGWYLCGGGDGPDVDLLPDYSMGNLGINSNGQHSAPDQTIGNISSTAATGTHDIPDDAGMALLNIGSNIVTQCVIGSLGCPSGFNYSDPGGGGTGSAVVFDKVGFNPYGPGSPMNTGPGVYPGNIYPSLAAQYCEGTLIPSAPGGVAKNLGCLQPVGDASTVTLGPGAPCPGAGQFGPFFVEAPNREYTQAGPGTQYDTRFPVTDSGFITRADGIDSAVRACYGESGQYKIERRRSGQTFDLFTGEIHKDSYSSMTVVDSPPQNTNGACAQSSAAICGNNDDFILDAPNPSTNNVGLTQSGVSGISSVLGNAWPHNSSAPSIFGNGNPVGGFGFTQSQFDTCAGAVIPCTPNNQLGPRNAERRYAQDPNIRGTANDPFGTFILRLRYTNNLGVPTAGQRWRINDLSTLCGGQTLPTTNITIPAPQTSVGVATQEARNLRGPDFSTVPAQTPTPNCQGEPGTSDVGFFTAIFKGVNHYGEVVNDSSGTSRVVAGTVLEDIAVASGTPLSGTTLQPFGAGSNSTYVVNTTAVGNTTLNVAPLGPAAITLIGDGVSAGTGSFTFPIASAGTLRIAFKFGVVRSGRFKLFLGREIAVAATPLP
jgi:hypothetical protein